MSDKFNATWVSHTSISDYLKCPRAYYLNNVYKDPATGHKVKIMNPSLALGQSVHEVVESLSSIPTADRFKESLLVKFSKSWNKVTGLKGGFESEEDELKYRMRGEAMLKRVMNNPGPVSRLAVKIKQDLPHYWLSEKDEIILCGKIDWLEYLPDIDAVKIIDFKTSKKEEDSNSLQLPIYMLLASNCQQRKVVGASYWYLEMSNDLSEKKIPNMDEATTKLLKIAKDIKLARKLNRLKCSQGENGCRHCKPMERIINHEGTFVGVNEYNQDIYILKSEGKSKIPDSEIL